MGGGSSPKRYHSRSVHQRYKEKPRKKRSYPSSSEEESDDDRSPRKHSKRTSNRHQREKIQERRHSGHSSPHKESHKISHSVSHKVSRPHSHHGSDAGKKPNSQKQPSTKSHTPKELEKPSQTRPRSRRQQHDSESGTSSNGDSSMPCSSSDGSLELHTRVQPMKSKHGTTTLRSSERKSKEGRRSKPKEEKDASREKVEQSWQQQKKKHSRSGQKSRSGRAVAEGVKRWPCAPICGDSGHGKYDFKTRLKDTYISRSSEGDADDDCASVAGDNDEIAGSCAGKTHCSDFEPQEDGALNVVIDPCASLKLSQAGLQN